jgi:glycerol uptake facilitator-like aquaporin
MTLTRRLVAEFLGTAGLLAVVVGSGIMGDRLSQGNEAIALLANSLATGAGLVALIQTFGPVSGAHFNPAVTLVEALWKRIEWSEALGYGLVQLLGAICGVVIAHLMFGLNLVELSEKSRIGWNLGLSELVASFGLITVIAISGRRKVEATPYAVSAFITSAYWFTSSTSFANPAVTFGRMFTPTFTGIAPSACPGFVVGQFLGAFGSYLVCSWLLSDGSSRRQG